MPVDILDPNYWITELFGDVVIFAVFLLFFFLYLGSKLKLNFQMNIALLTLGFLMLPMLFDSFLAWVPIIIVVIGLVVGSIAYRYLERT